MILVMVYVIVMLRDVSKAEQILGGNTHFSCAPSNCRHSGIISTLGVANGMTCSQPPGQQLSIDDDLAVLLEELDSVCAKWYNIGMKLGVRVCRLDAIRAQYRDLSDCLRETLAAWLRAHPTPTTWSKVVEALNSAIVNEGMLATNLKHKYCSSIHTDTTTPSHPHSATLTGIQQHSRTTLKYVGISIFELSCVPLDCESSGVTWYPLLVCVRPFPENPRSLHNYAFDMYTFIYEWYCNINYSIHTCSSKFSMSNSSHYSSASISFGHCYVLIPSLHRRRTSSSFPYLTTCHSGYTPSQFSTRKHSLTVNC